MTTRAQRIATTRAQLGADGLRAATTVWLVVNAVNLLQAVGFAARPIAPGVNPALGLVIAALAIPATRTLPAFARARVGRLWIAGPLTFDAFVVLMLGVDHLARYEWRDPLVAAVAVPYLGLFFGSIFLMGLPMLRVDPRRWVLTAVTTLVLLGAMLNAMALGAG